MPSLTIDLIDVYGAPIRESVFVQLQQVGSQNTKQVTVEQGRVSIAIEHHPHRLFVDPPSYLPTQRFVQPGSIEIQCVMDSRKVKSMVRPEYGHIANMRYGPTEYAALPDERCAGLLNVMSKAQQTILSDGRDVWSHVTELTEVRQDRCFAMVDGGLRSLLASTSIFSPVSSSLHNPPPGYTHAGSYKSDDQYGNLQVTLFNSGALWMADLDIDDAAGLGHVFQVVRNSISGRPTHPYDIHQILLAHQHLDTRYRLHVA